MKTKLLLAAASAAAVIGTSAHAEDFSKDAPLTLGPVVHQSQSPYNPALMCLKNVLTPDEKNISFGVLPIQDKTGKMNPVADDGTGAFSTQGGSDRMITALKTIGVSVIDVDPNFFGAVNWYASKAVGGLVGNDDHTYGVHHGPKDPPSETRAMPFMPNASNAYGLPINLPDVMLAGSFTSLDFLPGSGGEISVFGIGGGYREYRALVGMDVRATRMPFVMVPKSDLGTSPYRRAHGGEIIDAEHLQKQMVADEYKADAGAILGTVLITADAGTQDREAIQDSEGDMIDYAAYRLVSTILGVHTCDGYAEQTAQYTSQTGQRVPVGTQPDPGVPVATGSN